MKRLLRRLLCFIIGHWPNGIGMEHGEYDCERCGYRQDIMALEPFYLLRPFLTVWWKARYYLFSRIGRARLRLLTVRLIPRRFRKEDDIPF
jgi:hypothetical protein